MYRALAFVLPLALAASACTYDNGDAHHVLYDNGPSSSVCGDTVQSTIDTDATLVVTPGQGAGVFVEYASGGHYHVRTACDTSRSNATCLWDIIVTPEAGKVISNVVPEGLEGNDSLVPFDTASYRLVANTSTEIDGFTFDVDPGVSISVDALLDNVCATPYFFWNGDGGLHSGSPSNPLTLTPSGP